MTYFRPNPLFSHFRPKVLRKNSKCDKQMYIVSESPSNIKPFSAWLICVTFQFFGFRSELMFSLFNNKMSEIANETE